MKKLSTILLAVILAGLDSSQRPGTEGAQLGPGREDGSKGAPAPKVKSAGKSGGQKEPA